MENSNNRRMSFADLIKHRRSALHLRQQQVADALRVGSVAVGHWENGTRRIDLDKLPRLAAVLQLNEQDVCRTALREFHPLLYLALFGTDQPPGPSRA